MRSLALAAGEAVGVLFPIVDPIGGAPVFAALTKDLSPQRRLSEARKAAIITVLALLLFMAAGEPLLHFFGVSLESLQIAGGLVIGYTGFQMIVAPATPAAVSEAGNPRGGVALVPMAMPLLAGPGALAVVMGLEARDEGALKFPGFGIGIIVIGALVYLCLRGSTRIVSVLGEGGAEALTRVFGLLALAIGVELVIHGVVEHGAVTRLTKA